MAAPLFTQRHYELLARKVNKMSDKKKANEIGAFLMQVFADDNPRFKIEKFAAAYKKGWSVRELVMRPIAQSNRDGTLTWLDKDGNPTPDGKPDPESLPT
jgi:hypothetical protein